MNTEVSDIKTIEEYSLFALERSVEGLDELCDASRRCAAAITTEKPGEAFPQISALAVNLHNFDVFQHELCSFLLLDADAIGDSAENLAVVQHRFKAILEEMADHIGAGRISALTGLLADDLPAVLQRFKALLPQMRTYIRDEYLQPA